MATSGAFRKTRRFTQYESRNGRQSCLFVPRRSRDPRMAAGLYYSTTTGNTETAAGYIADATGLEAVDIGDASADDIAACDSLIIGAPTWHTGADEERSGTAWDEFLYGDLTSIDLTGKKVAIFGMGDQSGYADNYCDAMDELATCFEKRAPRLWGWFRRTGTSMRTASRYGAISSLAAPSTRTTSQSCLRRGPRNGSLRSRGRESPSRR